MVVTLFILPSAEWRIYLGRIQENWDKELVDVYKSWKKSNSTPPTKMKQNKTSDYSPNKDRPASWVRFRALLLPPGTCIER